jgi:hypothetical protein
LVVGLVLIPALTQSLLAQTQSSVEPSEAASSELPAITVEPNHVSGFSVHRYISMRIEIS